MSTTSDILWIETRLPAIASIYYFLHLKSTHVLYCPDDDNNNTSTMKHVRDLARDILRVIDSNNYKKLALHFAQNMTISKRDDLVRFLLKRRPRLTLSCLTLPCTAIQLDYLSGWAHSLEESLFWRRQCLLPPKELISPTSSLISTNQSFTGLEFNESFVISHPFKRKALFVHITREMIDVSSAAAARDDGVVLRLAALLPIQGWIDAILSLASENGNTLIFIMNENSLFTDTELAALQTSNQQQQELEHRRRQLWHMIETLADRIPIYLYLESFTSSIATTVKIYNQMAWLQHVHHLCISHSVLLTWQPYQLPSSTSQPPPFPQLEHLYLTSVAKYDRAKWKTVFSELLQKVNAKPGCDSLRYIAPSKLDIQSSNNLYTAPLLTLDKQQFESTRVHVGNQFRHSLSSLNFEVIDTWMTHMKQSSQLNMEQQKNKTNNKMKNNSDQPDEQIASPSTALSRSPSQSPKSSSAGLQLELEDIAEALDHDKVQYFIANTGAYSRGSGLLHTLSHFTYTLYSESNSVIIFCKAQGTNDVPYQVYISLKSNDTDQVISHGFCSCPVGGKGRCKHCTALLLRFMMNVDEFDPSPEKILMPTGEDTKYPTKIPAIKKQNTSRSAAPSGKSPIIQAESASEELAKPVIPKAAQHKVSQESPMPNRLESKLPISEQCTTNDNSNSNKQASVVLDLANQHPSSSTPISETNIHTEPGVIASQRRRILPWSTDKGNQQKKQRITKAAKTATRSSPTSSKTIDSPVSGMSDTSGTTALSPARQKRETARRCRKTQPVTAGDTDDGDSDADYVKQIGVTKSIAQSQQARRRQPTRGKYMEQGPLSSSIDDANITAEHSYDQDTDISSTSSRSQHFTRNTPRALSTAHIDLDNTDDDDQLIESSDLAKGSESRNHDVRIRESETSDDDVRREYFGLIKDSPQTVHPGSSLSLPMTDLALFSSTSAGGSQCTGSETEDEDDTALLASFQQRQPTSAVNTKEDDQRMQHRQQTVPRQQRQPDIYHREWSAMTTSDLFDELDL